MYKSLQKLESSGNRLNVGVLGCGAMGRGVALQVERSPGMRVTFLADTNAEALERTAQAIPAAHATSDPLSFLQSDAANELDAIVECTSSIGDAAEYCLAAIDRKAHVVLMNAEVDLALGQLIAHRGRERGVIVTSDAGDQHGVLARMIDEIQMWNFRIVQAGNIKGYLDRYATAQSLVEEAAKRDLNVVQCCAYTDGTKLSIEMALVANAFDLRPTVAGMEGPRCADVSEAMELFDFDAYGEQGRIDYILGAEPGGGVYVIGHCDDPVQARYLRYYKLGEEPPYYLFYRPYHLCHVETPTAIARACVRGEPILAPAPTRACDVYAYAKCDIPAGTEIEHGLGGDFVYGLVEQARPGALPVTWLEPEGGKRARIVNAIAKDAPIALTAVELPDTQLHSRLAEQAALPAP